MVLTLMKMTPSVAGIANINDVAMTTYPREQQMTKNWKVMQDVEDAFNQIIAINMLVEEIESCLLQGDTIGASAATQALKTFTRVYEQRFDRKFARAWERVVTPQHDAVHEVRDQKHDVIPEEDVK